MNKEMEADMRFKTTLLSAILVGVFTFVGLWIGSSSCEKETGADIKTLRNTFRAGAAFSELHHAETAHYPDEEKINAAIEAIENGRWKEFLDGLVEGDSASVEPRGDVFIAPEGQDSGKE